MTELAVVLADESKKSGPIGLAVILVLCVICYFLFKSMSRHLRKVREEFPSGDPVASADPAPSAPEATPPAEAAEASVSAESDRPEQPPAPA